MNRVDGSWQMFQWRHWQPASALGRKGRWGRWHKCTQAEYESPDNNTGTQKRVLACTPKPDTLPPSMLAARRPAAVEAGGGETVTVLRAKVQEAIDLLAERRYGNNARSPGHNARLVLEALLSTPARTHEAGWYKASDEWPRTYFVDGLGWVVPCCDAPSYARAIKAANKELGESLGIQEAQSPVAWREMDSAPQDRNAKMLGLLPSGRACTIRPSWRQEYILKDDGSCKAGAVVFAGYNEDRGDALIPCRPTRWMPIPGETAAAPVPASGEVGEIDRERLAAAFLAAGAHPKSSILTDTNDILDRMAAALNGGAK